MIEKRIFHLGDILSVTTGYIVSDRHMDAIYDVLSYMTGHTLFSNQLGKAKEQCLPHIFAQHPKLEEVDVSSVNTKNWKQWLNEQISKYGEQLEIKPLVSGIYKHKDPLEELQERFGEDKVIKVDLNNLKNDNRSNFDPSLN